MKEGGTNRIDPWTFKGTINQSNDQIDLLEKWDKSKSSTKRYSCCNRAKLWIARLLKRDVQVPQAYKLRHEDIQNALDHMIHDCFAIGMSPKDYLIFCLASTPIEIKEVVDTNEKSSNTTVLPNMDDQDTLENSGDKNELSSTPSGSKGSTTVPERPRTGKICRSIWKGLNAKWKTVPMFMLTPILIVNVWHLMVGYHCISLETVKRGM